MENFDRIKVYYDTQPNDVITKISSQLKKIGYMIEELGGDGDGYIEYLIKKIDE